MATSFGTSTHPIILGIVGDSAAGKTTLSRGIAQILGSEGVSFFPGTSPRAEQGDDAHLNVRLTLYGTLPHPDLSEVIAEDRSGCVRAALGREGGRAVEHLEIDGAIPDEPAASLERCIFDHLDACGAAPLADLGQYSDFRSERSHPLALTQSLLVYHLLRAKQREEIEA